jgi:hypothetical protein
MRKIIAILLVVPFICFAQKADKKTVKPVPEKTAAPAVEKEAPKTKDVVFDGFEAEKPALMGKTFLSANGGQEETNDDSLKIDINKDAKFVKEGKQSLKVTYSAKPVKDGEKFAMLSLTSSKPMGANTAISFWVNKVKGKGSISLSLFDNVGWKKRTSQSISLDKDGWMQVKLAQADFTAAPNWDKVNIVQINVKGDLTFYMDDLRFLAK